MDHKIKLSNFPIQVLCTIVLAGFMVGVQAQAPSVTPSEPKIIIRVEPVPPEKEEVASANPNAPDPALGEGKEGPNDCELKYPMPPSKKASDPYVEDGNLICKRLEVRGLRMQCEIDKLINDRSGVFATTGAKTELANWARCNEKIAKLLIDGYYIQASEIERRLQICSANFYADPGKAPRLGGLYTRFIRWMNVNDFTPPPSDAALETAIKQSTPLNSQENVAGLMKCEWMFATSKTPQIDPLPSIAAPPTPKFTPSPAKPAAKKPSN
jgi:hypothetical protein